MADRKEANRKDIEMLKKAKMKRESAVAANVSATLAQVFAGLSRRDAENVSARIDAASFGECQICCQDPCWGVLVARNDHMNQHGVFTIFGLCECCHDQEMDEVLSCFAEAGLGHLEIHWFERKQVH
jgi:hypothetical protein